MNQAQGGRRPKEAYNPMNQVQGGREKEGICWHMGQDNVAKREAWMTAGSRMRGVRLGVYYIMTTRTGGGQHNITEDGCMEGNWGQNAAQSHGTMPLGEGS